MRSRAGFSLTEMLVVVAIILIVGGISVPTLSRAVDNAKLKSAAQQVAGLYEQAKIRATQDDTYHELLASPAQMCLDLDGNAACDASDPDVELPAQVSLISQGVPVELDPAVLGFAPLNEDNSATYNQQGTQVHALAWNSRGLPCQRTSPSAVCSNNGQVAWVQYLQLQRTINEASYAAVTVSPTGRVKVWTYASGSNNGRNWF
ncbi:MAG: pilus assembly FimT family protein [Candidatus Angelobacter sp.]